MDDCHSKHCFNCYSFTLCEDRDECSFMQCPTCKTAVFHQCKLAEHLLLCENAVVDCLNKDYGCPKRLCRDRMGPHLAECPASVVVCMAEWNRWPLFASDRYKHIPFRQKNPLAEEGQLDFELALRDQRMLDNMKKIPRKSRVSLRNNLTRRHPAVPLPSSLTHRSNDDDDDDDELDVGLQVEFVGLKDDQLSKQMKQWQDDLDARIGDKALPPKYEDYPELEKGNVHKHCAYCFDIHCDRTYAAFDKDSSCGVVKCRFECGSLLHSCKMFEHRLICPKYEEEDDFAWMYRGVKSSSGKTGGGRMKKKKDAVSELKSAAVEPSFTGPGEPANRVMQVAKDKDGKPFCLPKPPIMPQNVHRKCRLDVRLETITRLQTKPRSMFTFVCGQELKRSELAPHSLNVHSEIHGGLNSWLEHRCPLAWMGCGFSSRRLFPRDSGHTLVYNRVVEAFGIAKTSLMPVLKRRGDDDRCYLAELPLEILVQIIRLLDSFTLCNLSLTSVWLRNICCDLLDEKGCVSLQWERLKDGEGRIRWRVAYKRWFFSTSVEPVSKWTMTEHGAAVSNHLLECPFNVKKKLQQRKKCQQWDDIMNHMISRIRSKRRPTDQ